MAETIKSTPEDQTAERPPLTSRQNEPESPHGATPRKWWWLGGGVVVLFLLFWGFVSYVDRVGWEFFNKGRDAVIVLNKIAKAMKESDLKAVETLYSSAFQGRSLGINNMQMVEERDGVRIYAFQPSGETQNRQAAMAEWQQYLDSFETIEEVGMYVHRMEKWQGTDDIVASVRFELIGTPKGEQQSSIDRAYFRVHFQRADQSFLIGQTEFIEGDRVINSRPLFVDVAPGTGIDFENQYYPAFLTQKLKFGMLRYGPAGITAADFDSDGFCDLFVPDGVESRLFRNLGDGQFEDVTAQTGLSGLSGVSVGLFADYDNDGDRDFFVSRTFEPNQLFENQNGAFVDVTEKSGINPDNCTTVASWGDYNNDGFLDLYVGRYLEPRERIPTTFYARNGEPNQLYKNNGDGTFTNVTEEAGVGEVGLCLGTAFGDYNDDGYPDLYVSNDFGRKTLYKNNGDGTFDDVTVETGTLAYGAGMSSTIGDYDNDGDLDFYVAHIRSEEGWFAEWPTVLRYMANSWRQGVWITDMPLYFGIFKQSGFQFVQVFQDMASGNALLRNNGDGTFKDVSWEANANPPGWFWGTNMVDFDNDGWQDLYAANGWVYNEKDTEIELDFLNKVVSEQKLYKTGYLFDPNYFGKRSWHGWERNRYLRNNGDGTFKEVGRGFNADLLLNSRGTAVADFWNRGMMDLAVAASTARHALLRNEINADRNWVQFKLVGAAKEIENGTNHDAVGARVILRSGDMKMVREVMLGNDYGSQSTLRLHFGLGELNTIDELEVRWPCSGIVQRFENVSPNHRYEIKENRDELVEKTPGGSSVEG
ncbi:MAG: CRTAC1 family protein [Candidatus Latescibacteria bacterium]|nr:CRTAC1 family protein [Candidatus Latescibacterota bacterium]